MKLVSVDTLIAMDSQREEEIKGQKKVFTKSALFLDKDLLAEEGLLVSLWLKNKHTGGCIFTMGAWSNGISQSFVIRDLVLYNLTQTPTAFQVCWFTMGCYP
jgi:hypothetical protein